MSWLAHPAVEPRRPAAVPAREEMVWRFAGPVALLALLGLSRLLPETGFGLWVRLAAATLVVLLLAWLVHRVVEVPCGPRLRRAVTLGLERLRAVVLDAVNRGPRILAATAGGRPAPSGGGPWPAQCEGSPPTGPASRVPWAISSQNAGDRSASRSTVDPMRPGR